MIHESIHALSADYELKIGYLVPPRWKCVVSANRGCTRRRLLGGKQYSSVFPTFLGLVLGDKAVPWLWRYQGEQTRTAKFDYHLELADGILQKTYSK
ncbi:MAG TPA: hypothetical protein VN040_05235 [Pseudosphingobacterium sp.]|nr:hypothetical protein [Pseudosphingobacterium sp.]